MASAPPVPAVILAMRESIPSRCYLHTLKVTTTTTRGGTRIMNEGMIVAPRRPLRRLFSPDSVCVVDLLLCPAALVRSCSPIVVPQTVRLLRSPLYSPVSNMLSLLRTIRRTRVCTLRIQLSTCFFAPTMCPAIVMYLYLPIPIYSLVLRPPWWWPIMNPELNRTLSCSCQRRPYTAYTASLDTRHILCNSDSDIN